MDVAVFVDNYHFVSGSESGAVALWTSNRRKPLFELRLSSSVLSVASIPFSNVFAVGSTEPKIRVYRLNNEFNAFSEIALIDVSGLPVDLKWSYGKRIYEEEDSQAAVTCKLVACVSNEQRLGRWVVDKRAQQGIYVYGFIGGLGPHEQDEPACLECEIYESTGSSLDENIDSEHSGEEHIGDSTE